MPITLRTVMEIATYAPGLAPKGNGWPGPRAGRAPYVSCGAGRPKASVGLIPTALKVHSRMARKSPVFSVR